MATPAELKARFPAFADVADLTVQYWLDDAARSVGTHWPIADRDVGIMTLAAHRMALIGLGKGGTGFGVTSIKSGTFTATISDKVASASGFSATIYGQQYLDMCKRLFGGARLVRTSDHV